MPVFDAYEKGPGELDVGRGHPGKTNGRGGPSNKPEEGQKRYKTEIIVRPVNPKRTTTTRNLNVRRWNEISKYNWLGKIGSDSVKNRLLRRYTRVYADVLISTRVGAYV